MHVVEIKKLDDEISLFTTKFDIGDQVMVPDGSIGTVVANRPYEGMHSEFKGTFDSEIEFPMFKVWLHRYQLKGV